MPTSYIETKVEEFHNKVCDSQMFDDQGNEITDEVLSFLSSSLESLLRKAMEEAEEELMKYWVPMEEDGSYQADPSTNQLIELLKRNILSSLQALGAKEV